MNSKYIFLRLFISFIFQFIFSIAIAQFYLTWDLLATHLSFNDIGGLQFSNSLEFVTKNNCFQISGHMTYATGNRDFEYNVGEPYTFVDGANRDLYPLPGIIPGLPEDSYITVLGLNTAKTIDNGFTVSYGRLLINKDRLMLKTNVGLNLSWIEETSIAYAFQGDFTNVFGTGRDINLIIPFTQKYFDLGPQFAISSHFIGRDKLVFGISGELVWLLQTGFKYNVGPSVKLNLQ